VAHIPGLPGFGRPPNPQNGRVGPSTYDRRLIMFVRYAFVQIGVENRIPAFQAISTVKTKELENVI